MKNEIQKIITDINEGARGCGYKGIDPYDALNSPLCGIMSLWTRWGRIALTQFGRRCPINF